MGLSPGTKLGPYEILATIGAGGMGEVYRAKDPRLKREVAIKVLPASFSSDAERLRRFEQEAQAAGALNHPNITAVYELGSHEGSPYIVTELLEGETLRGRLSGGGLPVRKATEYAIQTAKGLAAAHEKGIVHRDLKPENLFVTNDGRVKILDFGLAKLTQADGATGPQTNLPTATGGGTEPGVVMGTLGYMSPEQVKGKPTDARSDIFSFGAILYEMLSGSRAFHRDTAAETMSAILREEPPDLSATNKNVQPGLERVVRHCLEKSPEERFHSAHDLAFDLEALSGTSATIATSAAAPGAGIRLGRIPLLAAALIALAALAAGYFAGKSKGVSAPPMFKQLTFRKGAIWGARFGSDGKSILTTAAWDGKPAQIYVSRPESPEAIPFGVPDADIAAVSTSGDVALLLKADFNTAFTRTGTLARVAATGGAPRELLERVNYADWTPDGKDLAIVRVEGGKCRLELPAGKVLYETTGWIGQPRISPRGDRIAFLDHPVVNDDGGAAAIVDTAGKKTTISPEYATVQGLAWSPDGSEVWYTAAEVGGNRTLYASSPGGRTRALARIAGNLTLHDVARDGRVLVSHDNLQTGIIGRGAGAPAEVDLTWLDWSLLADISADGRTLLFSETAEGGGKGYSVYIRGLDGSPAVRLGEGNAQRLSPDGKRVLALVGSPGSPDIVIYPTGAGESKKISAAGLVIRGAGWLPDGRHILATAREPGKRSRSYILDTEGSKPRPITPEGYRGILLFPDGAHLLSFGPDGGVYVSAIDGGGEPRRIEGLSNQDALAGWTADGRLYVRRGNATRIPMHVDIVDLATGKSENLYDLIPSDSTGINALQGLRITANRAYAYSYYRQLSNLFLVDGLHR
jgi:eukaryotic-like serine/threonine-protein kinase